MKTAHNDNFSEFVSALIVLFDSYNEQHDDVDLWGAPSECHSDLNSFYERDVQEAFEDYGYTHDEFWKELHRRGISDKWAYEHIPPIEFIH